MITIDYTDRTPIYLQIVKSIEKLIALGVLKPEEKLPSIRSLGIELSTNHNTVQKAYAHLEQQGTIYSVKGVGNFVSQQDFTGQKIQEILDQAQASLKTAVSYGLTQEDCQTWLDKQRRILYDQSK